MLFPSRERDQSINRENSAEAHKIASLKKLQEREYKNAIAGGDPASGR